MTVLQGSFDTRKLTTVQRNAIAGTARGVQRALVALEGRSESSARKEAYEIAICRKLEADVHRIRRRERTT